MLSFPARKFERVFFDDPASLRACRMVPGCVLTGVHAPFAVVRQAGHQPPGLPPLPRMDHQLRSLQPLDLRAQVSFACFRQVSRSLIA